MSGTVIAVMFIIRHYHTLYIIQNTAWIVRGNHNVVISNRLDCIESEKTEAERKEE